MDNESDANNNESDAINKSQATTCCGSGSIEFGETNNKYGPNNNKSGATCCCGSVSIETGTNVAAMVLCVLYMVLALFTFFLNNSYNTAYNAAIVFGLSYNFIAGFCFLVVSAQQVRNPWLFLPCLILGAIEVIGRVFLCFAFLVCATQKEPAESLPKLYRLNPDFVRNSCMGLLIGFAVSIPLFVWLYSIIFRGFLAVKKAESGRSRPPV